MPEMTSYDHGVPSWVDIGAPDREAAVRFYGELFGWEAQDLGEDSGHYTMMSKDGKLASAISTATDPGPPRWTTYVNVDDVDDIAKRVEQAGGTVVFGPMAVMTAGKMAIFADTTGAVVAAWQPEDHPGAQLVNEPGTLIWNELNTSDLEKSKAFYSSVFGWEWGGAPEYAEAQVNGRTVLGVMPRPAAVPADVPDHWLVYFGTSDVDADAERATTLGATVVAGPADVPGSGRFAVLVDPQGAAFGLYGAK